MSKTNLLNSALRARPLPTRNGVSPSYICLDCSDYPTIYEFLCAHFTTISAETWRARMAKNEVRTDSGLIVDISTPYQTNICVYYYREIENEPKIPFQEQILFQDDYLVAVDKPHFLPVNPGGQYLQETLLVRLKNRLQIETLAPIHRLDRETAGVMVFTIQPHTRGLYQRLFAERQVQKVYEAIAPHRDDLVFPHTRRSRIVDAPVFYLSHEVEGQINAETLIEIQERRGPENLYRLHPATGKKHQLRLHMAALGLPIRNDRWYGTQTAQPPEFGADDYQAPLKLLARSIQFIDPILGIERRFESERQL